MKVTIAILVILAWMPAAVGQADPPPRVTRLLAEINAQMVDIPGGSFEMGNAKRGDERPVHTVTVRPFRLAKYEVTMAQYDVFAVATRRKMPDGGRWGRGSVPAIDVSWNDAQAFAAWLSQVSGLGFRLPSEAEWEYAARAGSTTDYPWGERFSRARANGGDAGIRRTIRVGSFRPNAFGLFDMIGNVYEWTEDCFTADYEFTPADGSAWTRGNCENRVYRGGSWDTRSKLSRVSRRSGDDPGYRAFNVGFRLAQTP